MFGDCITVSHACDIVGYPTGSVECIDLVEPRAPILWHTRGVFEKCLKEIGNHCLCKLDWSDDAFVAVNVVGQEALQCCLAPLQFRREPDERFPRASCIVY